MNFYLTRIGEFLKFSLQDFERSVSLEGKDSYEYQGTDSQEKFENNKIYQMFFIPFRVEKVIWSQMIVYLLSLIQTFLFLPLNLLFISLKTLLKRKAKLSEREQGVILRLASLIFSTYLLLQVSQSSKLYHWIRGQSTFKLYLIKAIMEVSDILLKPFGKEMLEHWCRGVLKEDWKRKCFDSLMLSLYLFIHAFVLCMEQFTLHIVATSSWEQVLAFTLYNNFGEIKISVFKKVGYDALYQYMVNDSVERFQQMIYMLNILATSNKDLS